jgi:hypothetical protein
MLHRIPRDCASIRKAWVLDRTVTPAKWQKLEIRTMNEFDAKYRVGLQSTASTGIPKSVALRLVERSLFSGNYVDFMEGCEDLTAAANMAGQGGWVQGAPPVTTINVTSGMAVSGAQSASHASGAYTGAGYLLAQSVTQSGRWRARWKVKFVPTAPPPLRVGYVGVALTANGKNITGSALAAASDPDLVLGSYHTYTHTALSKYIESALKYFLLGSVVGPRVTPRDTYDDYRLEYDEDGSARLYINEALVASGTATAGLQADTINIFCWSGITPDDICIDDVVYETLDIEGAMVMYPNGIQVRSSSGAEDAALRAGVNIYTTPDRQTIEKKESAAAPGQTAEVLYSGPVYGIIGVGQSAYSEGIITFETTDEVAAEIATIMPFETSVDFQQLGFDPYLDRAVDFHMTYRRYPPIMTKDSDSTFLLPAELQEAIIRGAIADLQKTAEDGDWKAARQDQLAAENDFLRFHAPELVEEPRTEIVDEYVIGNEGTGGYVESGVAGG